MDQRGPGRAAGYRTERVAGLAGPEGRTHPLAHTSAPCAVGISSRSVPASSCADGANKLKWTCRRYQAARPAQFRTIVRDTTVHVTLWAMACSPAAEPPKAR